MSRATGTWPVINKAATAAAMANGIARINRFNHGREQTARASQLPSRTNLASVEDTLQVADTRDV
jgi:hypothetical protein